MQPVAQDAWRAKPNLTVKSVERGRGFPLIKNGQLFMACASSGLDLTHVIVFEGEPVRLVKLPAAPGKLVFAKVEDIVRAHVGELVPSARPENTSLLSRRSL